MKTDKTIILILLSVLILTACGQKADTKDDLASCRYQDYAGMSAEEIVPSLTMEQKAKVWRMCFAVNVISKAHCPVRGMIRSLGSKRKQHGWKEVSA